MIAAPAHPKIYHIVHMDRLAPIIASNGLLCDAVMTNHENIGTTIGLNNIKQRRLRNSNFKVIPICLLASMYHSISVRAQSCSICSI